MDNHIFRDKFHSIAIKGHFLFVEAEAVGMETEAEAVDDTAAFTSLVRAPRYVICMIVSMPSQ